MMVIYYSMLMIYYSTILYIAKMIMCTFNRTLINYTCGLRSIYSSSTLQNVNILLFPGKGTHFYLYIPGLNINGTALIKVDLSWSKHIEETCKSASKQIGLIYRIFYLHSSQATLRSLYVSLVHSKLEYAAPVWSHNK